MAIIPGKKNFTVDRRADFPIKLTFKDSTGQAINLTGYTVAAQVWEETRTTKYADFSVTYTDRAAGSVSIGLTDAQTKTFIPDVLKYDVLLVNPSNVKEYYLEGTIYISEGYTTV